MSLTLATNKPSFWSSVFTVVRPSANGLDPLAPHQIRLHVLVAKRRVERCAGQKLAPSLLQLFMGGGLRCGADATGLQFTKQSAHVLMVLLSVSAQAGREFTAAFGANELVTAGAAVRVHTPESRVTSIY